MRTCFLSLVVLHILAKIPSRLSYAVGQHVLTLLQVVASDDVSDSLGIDDDRPARDLRPVRHCHCCEFHAEVEINSWEAKALPLLVSLQNLFYRLQTSEAGRDV